MTAPRPTGCLALADGTLVRGEGFGAAGTVVGELCFNTAMTGYQEILTDPSYAGQVVLFTFPHIGNVGVNPEDAEAPEPVAVGMVVRERPGVPSSWRSAGTLEDWLARTGRIGLSGIDTRRLTRLIRDRGMPHVALCHAPDGAIDEAALVAAARGFAGLEGADLAAGVSRDAPESWKGTGNGTGGSPGRWDWPQGFANPAASPWRVVALDFGVKRNILRCLASAGCAVTVLPASSGGAEILEAKPDGLLLTNGPGDPAATGEYAVPAVRTVLDAGVPVFGICLGHQLLALALGARTTKMRHGHHGANHPVRDLATGQISVVSMNHGFTVDRETLPEGVVETHVSLFDGSNCGIRSGTLPAFSVQFHPEASPGPQDSFGLFDRFAQLMHQRLRDG